LSAGKRTVDEAVLEGMMANVDEFGPRVLPSVSINELRANLSETISRAAFGGEPVLVERRGRKIAAVISMADLAFLERMRQRREQVMGEKLPTDQAQIGAAIAQRLRRELFFS
jgi:prevent-host-death family protein